MGDWNMDGFQVFRVVGTEGEAERKFPRVNVIVYLISSSSPQAAQARARVLARLATLMWTSTINLFSMTIH
jgi:hypothetical protein